MGERELYDFWSDTYKVHHVAWSQEKAALVLDTWQRRFSEVRILQILIILIYNYICLVTPLDVRLWQIHFVVLLNDMKTKIALFTQPGDYNLREKFKSSH